MPCRFLSNGLTKLEHLPFELTLLDFKHDFYGALNEIRASTLLQLFKTLVSFRCPKIAANEVVTD